MTDEPVFFEDRDAFREWLEANHDSADVLWVGYHKVDAERSGIQYGESVEEALCFGWIDGLIRGIDDETYERRFTPRKPESNWSKANTERVEAMIEAGRMTPAGMALVEAAQASGAWEGAYRLSDDHEVPDELEAALRENGAALEHFQAFSNTDKHAYIALYNEAKTEETRQKRLERTVELVEQNLRAYDEDLKRRL